MTLMINVENLKPLSAIEKLAQQDWQDASDAAAVLFAEEDLQGYEAARVVAEQAKQAYIEAAIEVANWVRAEVEQA